MIKNLFQYGVMDDYGISREGDVVDIGTEMGVIEKSGSFYKYNGETIAQGREVVKDKFKEDKKLMKDIEQAIWKKIQEE